MKTPLRDRTFVWRDEPKPHGDWLAGDPIRSAIYNLLSLGLAAHEARVMRTFRAIESQVRDLEVKEDVKALIAQEGRHHRAHDPLNLALTTADSALRLHYERLRSRHMKLSEESSFDASLGYLLSTEFAFGCMGRTILSTDDFFAGADPDIAALWIYHSLEELEHTRVSFDVTIDHYGDNALPKLLKASLKRILGQDDGDLTQDSALQIRYTERLRFNWVADAVESLTAATMRSVGIKALCDYYMSEECFFFRRSAGWYDLFDPSGWHPSRRYEEDMRLIDHWDGYLRSHGYLR